MMFRAIGSVSVLLAVFVLSSGFTAAAQDAARGAALLAQARTVLGGEERLGAVKTLDVRGRFRRALGQMTMDGELQIRMERPDRLRRDEDFSPPGGGPAIVRTEVLDGATVWDENTGGRGFVARFGGGGLAGRGDGSRGGQGARGMTIDPAQLEEAQRRARQVDLARFMLAWLLAADGPVAWIGTAEAPDGRADVLEVSPATGPVTRLFLDEETHLPLMLTWEGAAPQLVAAGRRGGGGRGADGPPALQGAPGGERATLRMTLDDYKTVNGIMLPHLITRGVNDMTIEEWTIGSYRVNPSFRADVFRK